MKTGLFRKCIMLLTAILLIIPNSSFVFAEENIPLEEEDSLVAHYSFEENLMNDTQNGEAAKETGDRINNTGGHITYVNGIVGQAAKFDGESGVRLPDDLISSHTYSISLWLNPEELTDFTTTFFGAARTPDKWMSLVPKSWDDQTRVWSRNGEDYYDDATTGPNIKPNQWTHIAFTVNEGEFSSYVNG